MQTATITYNNEEAIKILNDIGKYLDFTIEIDKPSKKKSSKKNEPEFGFINGVPYQKADPKADIKKLIGLFDGKNYTKESLRAKAWKKR